MKCENCGKEEVNFHFTSNINGNITEKHLCAECAEKLGWSGNQLPQPEMPFEEIFMDLFGMRPGRRKLSGYGLMFPTLIIPTVGVLVPKTGHGGETPVKPEVASEIKPEIDVEMQKRREVNILREQMNQAVAAEDFEKAATIRDSIKKLENGDK